MESSLGFERIWKFLQEPVKRSKDLGSTVFLQQLLKNDRCANVLMETKTKSVFEAETALHEFTTNFKRYSK